MERSGKKRRGEGGGVDCFAVLLFKVTPSDDKVSKSLSPIVHYFDDCNISGTDIIIKNNENINKRFICHNKA